MKPPVTLPIIAGLLTLCAPAIAEVQNSQADSKADARLAHCISPQHRQFDFWVGEWDVFPNGKDKQVAQSRIEKLYHGCAIRENWMPHSGGGGGSLNNYDADAKTWRQTWIDSSGTRVEFSGGMIGETMVLTGRWRNIDGPGKHALVRMNYCVQEDGSVRQHGEQSTDFGKSWQSAFDFIYRKRSNFKEGQQ